MSSKPYCAAPLPVFIRCDGAALRDRGRCAVPHQRAASRPSLGTRALAEPARVGRRGPRDESWRHEPTWTLAQPARSTEAVDLTGRRRRSGNRSARDRDSPAGHITERPHHARSVSISRSTCMASARSDELVLPSRTYDRLGELTTTTPGRLLPGYEMANLPNAVDSRSRRDSVASERFARDHGYVAVKPCHDYSTW
jgi:hypothetical protein